MTKSKFRPEDVLDFWFPDDGHQHDRATHGTFWVERMQGGMDAAIITEFKDLTLAAARGELDHWTETPRGRLALVVALDQFPRSLWRDTPAAFGQDFKACRLSFTAFKSGESATLEPWEEMFHLLAVSHCEGPDHLERMDFLVPQTARIVARLEPPLEDMAQGFINQTERVRNLIAAYGRHPHRNPVYGRASSVEEEAYIAAGDFPHARKANPAQE
jgi:uncharacterized protein (DUF924 family)